LFGGFLSFAVAPFRWVARVKETLEAEVPRLAWNGVGRPLEIVEHDPGFALLGTSSGMYLTPCEDGSLTLSNKPSIFELLGHATQPRIASSLGVHEVERLYTRRAVLLRALEEDFKVADPSANMGRCARWWHNSQLLRDWTSRHFELSHCKQRAYLARTMGLILNLLLTKANLYCIPTSLNELACVVPLAIRNITATGGDGDIAKVSSQDAVMHELRRLLEACQPDEKVQELDHMPKQRFYTRSDNVLTASADRCSVSAEDVMCLYCKLRQLDSWTLMRFLDCCIRVLGEADRVAAQVTEANHVPATESKWSESIMKTYI